MFQKKNSPSFMFSFKKKSIIKLIIKLIILNYNLTKIIDCN